MKHNLYHLEADDDPCPDRPATLVTGIDHARFYPQDDECHYAFDERMTANLTMLVRESLGREGVAAYAALGKTQDPGYYVSYGPVEGGGHHQLEVS